MTSKVRNGQSTDIADYNSFVQTRAKAGHSAITDSCDNLFKVVGSTSSVNARVNTDSESSDTDAVIYLAMLQSEAVTSVPDTTSGTSMVSPAIRARPSFTVNSTLPPGNAAA